MKFSEAMLKGFEQVGGKQCRGQFRKGKHEAPLAYCVLGAVSAGRDTESQFWFSEMERFSRVWGLEPSTLNDGGLAWEHIYGMAVAAGL